MAVAVSMREQLTHFHGGGGAIRMPKHNVSLKSLPESNLS